MSTAGQYNGGTGVVLPFVSGSGRVGYIFAWVVMLGLGVTALVAGAVGSVTSTGTGGRVAGMVIGGIFAVLGAVTAINTARVFSRALAVDASGIRLIDPRGRAFMVQWGELSQVGICTQFRGNGGRFPVGYLDLIPGDPGFAGRHPEMSVLYHRFRAGRWWRLPLGPVRRLVGPLDTALRQFAGHRYGGVMNLRDLPRG